MTPIEVDVPPDPNERTPSGPVVGNPVQGGGWAGAAGGAGGVGEIRVVPEPCLICGAPEGGCSTHTDPFAHQVGPPVGDAAVVPRTIPASRRVRVQGTEDANNNPDAKVFICPDDVVEVFEGGIPGRTKRKSRRLVHRKGEVITRDRAIQLGLVEGTITPPPVPAPPLRTVAGQPVTVPQL